MDLTGFYLDLGIANHNLAEFLGIVSSLFIVGLVGWLAYFAARRLLPALVRRLAGVTHTQWGEWLLDRRFFNRLALFIVPIVLRAGIPTLEWKYMPTVFRLLDVWIVLAAAMLAVAFLNGINRVYEKMSDVRDKPVKIITQVVAVLIWCAVALIIISIFTHEQITVLLGGLTAFAAVLMLVFQDPILGFVAGIQLSSNNMVRLGDWIVVSSRGVDGEVTEIGLTTVKVQNWDKTITTIPTHKLVSESFTNWRGMEESGGRRIKRSVNIDLGSVHYLSDEEIETMRGSALLGEYTEAKVAELAAYNASRDSGIDERRLTNVGMFREYLARWIDQNPDINRAMTHMVRQLQPGPAGLPLEVYCFTWRQKWQEYEKVQADMFDHIYAVMPLFNLKPYQYVSVAVSGDDMR